MTKSDRFSKSHPWRVDILRPFRQVIGALVVANMRTGGTTEIAPATTIPQEPGERMFKTRRDASEIVAKWRSEHGSDVCSDPRKVRA